MPSAKNFFTEQEQDLIVKAIGEAELQTSGEIRLHLENFCIGNELSAAKKIFTKLKMHQTNERNGVLIYIATYSRKIAVVGDVGIHSKLGEQYWDKLVDALINKFKANKKAEALAESIIDCGLQLKTFFPRQDGDVNELNNQISF